MRSSSEGQVAWHAPTLVISLDLELAWGSFDHGYGPRVREVARWTHDHGAPALLEQLTGNGISATWAVVGMVMLHRLPDVSQLPQAFLPDGRDWFAHVPTGATEGTAPEWFGASFVKQLLAAQPQQEVGFHGYSHVILGNPRLPLARARRELECCADLARRFGIQSPSFVFPRNRIAHLDALRSAGFSCYRGNDEMPLGIRNEPLRRMVMLGADALGLPPLLTRPRVEDGIVNIPGSLMVRYLRGWRRHIPDGLRLRRLRAGLKLLRERGGIFHVWLHPENLFFERPRLERVMAGFLAEAGDLAAASKINVLTMGEVARQVRECSAASHSAAD